MQKDDSVPADKIRVDCFVREQEGRFNVAEKLLLDVVVVDQRFPQALKLLRGKLKNIVVTTSFENNSKIKKLTYYVLIGRPHSLVFFYVFRLTTCHDI